MLSRRQILERVKEGAIVIGSALGAVVTVGFAASSLSLAQSPAPPIRAFDLATLERLGRAIYEQDVQAALATDVLLAEAAASDAAATRGWIVDAASGLTRVLFVRERDGIPEAAYEVNFDGFAVQSRAPARDRRLDASALAQLHARRLAIASVERPCAQRYNTVALPDPDSGGWLVWALAATTEPGLILVGGHYRFGIAADGTSLLRRDALSRSCIAIDRSKVPAGAQPAGVMVTHLVSDTPVETHVYLSLLHKMPFSIATADRTLWEVEDGRITRMGTLPGDN